MPRSSSSSLQRSHQHRLQQRLEAQRAAIAAADHYIDGSPVVKAHTRVRSGQVQQVRRFYKGLGPCKAVPNVPRPRLRSWLLAHGVDEAQLGASYLLVTSQHTGRVTTHDLIDAGLLEKTAYFEALSSLPKGKHF